MKDIHYGLGYCHAMDRGMQMIMMKILGLGKGSEFLSGDDEMLEVDKFFRRMNWHNSLEEEVGKLTIEEKDILQAYCAGANASFKKHKPWELNFLLGYKDFSWQISDIILLARMAGYLTLAQSQGEVERLFIEMVQQGVSRELLNDLFPNINNDYDEELIKQTKISEKIIPDAVKWNVASSSFMASNNWVISGKLTKSGKPILANDPHLEINRLPSVWYEVGLKMNDQYVYSATMPGISSCLIGRSNHLSWGATYSFMDAIDSWIEKCENGKYFKDGSWHEFRMRKEVIKRKKGTSVEVIYYENEHGVLDGDPTIPGHYLSTKWSGDKTGAQSIRSGLNMWKAKNVKEGMDIIGNLEASFSWVLADSDGNIGMQMSGLMPKRKEGWNGFTPIMGNTSDNDWNGYHNVKDLPRTYNPDIGYIITTNNNLNHLGNKNAINICMGEYRANRIEELIQLNKEHQVNDSKKIHYDLYSLQATLFLPIIIPLLPISKNSEILKTWDCSYDIDSKGAYIFELIYRSLYSEVFGRILGKELNEFLQNETGIFIDFYANFDKILLSDNSVWFTGQSRADVYKAAIQKVIFKEAKPWGEFNQIELTHILLGGKLPKILGFDKGPYPLPGSRATVHQGQIYRSGGRQTSFAPSYRMITDMSQDIVHSNLSGGVSDRRFSKLYSNEVIKSISKFYKKITF